MFVKFCGFTRVEDILAANELPVNAAGFIFYNKSPRYIDPQKARELIGKLDTGIARVGVFVDGNSTEIYNIANTLKLDFLQLYNYQNVTELADLIPVIAAYRPTSILEITDINYDKSNLVLIDAFSAKGFGGTGESIADDLLKSVTKPEKTILAGGINIDNAVSLINKFNPYGIDLSSGIEDSPGIKSAEKMKSFIMKMKENNLI